MNKFYIYMLSLCDKNCTCQFGRHRKKLEIKPQFVEKNIHCSLSSSLIIYMEEQIKIVSKNTP